MQVYVGNPYPSLLPYLLFGLIFLLGLLPSKKTALIGTNFNHNTIHLMVCVYVFLVLLNTTWQAIFKVIELKEAMSAWVVFLFPVVFYWYFRRMASESEIRSVLFAVVVAGFLVGIYFAYDSYLKLALGQVTDYAYKAFQYSIDRSGQFIEEANTARINTGSRSFGLLQSHSVSGAWVVLGAFAALALLPQDRGVFRRASIFLFFGTMLFLGLNFTSIIAFIAIALLLVPRGQSIVRNLLSLLIILAASVGVIAWIANDAMWKYILEVSSFQKGLALGTGGINISKMGQAIEGANAYFQHILDFPPALLLGDGFSSFGLKKGGDVGFIETVATFGLPFFMAILLGFIRLTKAGFRQIKVCGSAQTWGYQPLQFAICVTLLVLITEAHYSIWPAKSILPIVFFALALYERYLPASRRNFSLKNNMLLV